MTSSIIQLNADEMSSALDGIQPIDLLAAELAAGAGGGDRPGGAVGRLVPWHGGTAATAAADADLVLLEDDGGRARCVLPAASLRACRAAALTGLAARELARSGPMTAVVIGAGQDSQPLLTVLAHQLPGVDRIAIRPAGGGPGNVIEPRMLDEIDLAGIGLSIVDDVRRAVRDAILVVAWGQAGEPLTVDVLADGALVVNAGDRTVSGGLAGAVDQVYVDDARLADGRMAHVDADLGQVLTGAHPGRTREDHILLVELLSASAPDVALARMLHRAAVERGFGSRLYE